MAICRNKKCSLGECDQAESCAAYVPVVTNADRIRAMSDDELAEWMAECNAYGEHADASQWLPWLKQTAE